MSIDDEVAVLRRIPLFAHIEPRKLKLLAFTSERLAFAPGQIVFRQGDEGDAAYVIIEGRADIVVEAASGPTSLAQVERNAIVGEIAILGDVPRTATVQALTRLETLRISKDRFLKLLREFPEIAVEIMRVLALRLAKTNQQLLDARDRLCSLGG
jgi:CRP-like cAMP-binding protein